MVRNLKKVFVSRLRPARRLATLALIAASSFDGASYADGVVGAGSTFASPIYTRWADDYRKAGHGNVIYAGTGSAKGVKQLIAGAVDFAGSDAPLSESELRKEGLVQFPTVIGAVVPVVNLPGIKAGQLMLSGAVLSDIYLGKITSWNDPAITALNPGLALPDTAIAVVRRVDGSGTSLIWTHYLSQVSQQWRTKIGEGETVHWPRGIGGSGNAGVATYVRYVPGAIGYVAWDFSKQNHLTYVAMTNAAGKVVRPGPDSFYAACANADWSRSSYQILTNEPGQTAWPLLGMTFILLRNKDRRSVSTEGAITFFDWALGSDARSSRDLDYIPLPDFVAGEIRSRWQRRPMELPVKRASLQ